MPLSSVACLHYLIFYVTAGNLWWSSSIHLPKSAQLDIFLWFSWFYGNIQYFIRMSQSNASVFLNKHRPHTLKYEGLSSLLYNHITFNGVQCWALAVAPHNPANFLHHNLDHQIFNMSSSDHPWNTIFWLLTLTITAQKVWLPSHLSWELIGDVVQICDVGCRWHFSEVPNPFKPAYSIGGLRARGNLRVAQDT